MFEHDVQNSHHRALRNVFKLPANLTIAVILVQLLRNDSSTFHETV